MWTINYQETNLVSRHQGTLPVILSCPHDGQKIPAGVPERTGSTPNCPPFSKSRDLHTREITRGVAQRLLDVFGEAPSVVIAEFGRKFIDANREAACAFEVPAARQFYDEYHNTLRGFVDKIRAEHGGLGLLFDIHGTSGIEEDPAEFYLGTDNGKTVRHLLQADPLGLFGPHSLRRFLEAAGNRVSPKLPGIPEAPELDGGFTVRTYGSSSPAGLDAIQIEIDDSVRGDEKRPELIEHLAFAIGNAAKRYAANHTFASFQSIDLLSGGAIQTVTAQTRGDSETNDWVFRIGGPSKYRGRVEIRNDPGATGEDASPRRAGVLVLHGEDGGDYYLWVDKQGRLRISASDPGSSSQAGIVVGRQT